MTFFLEIFIFIFGAIVGSFLNVVILRYNTGVSFFSGRSFCASCGKKLSWYELIPVISFLALRRKCAGCGSKISWQYPLIEIATGVLFLLTIFNFQFSIFQINTILEILYYWVIWSILIVIFVYDLRHKIIPDALVFLFSGFSLVYLILTSTWTSDVQVWDIAAGPLLAVPFAALWFFSRGRWMGLGDAKLVLGIGWFLGLMEGLNAVIVGFWLGALVGLLLIGIGKLSHIAPRLKGFGLKSEIPFGPFLIAGTIIAFFFDWNVFDLGFILF